VKLYVAMAAFVKKNVIGQKAARGCYFLPFFPLLFFFFAMVLPLQFSLQCNLYSFLVINIA